MSVGLMAAAVAFLPGVALGQSPAKGPSTDEPPAAKLPLGSFESLPSAVKLGEQVRIVGMDGKAISGRVAEMSPSGLVLLSGGMRKEVTAGAVQRIQRDERDSLLNGAMIGLSTGAGLVLLSAASTCRYCNGRDWQMFGLAAAVYGGVGAAIGAGIDALIRDHTVIYQRSDGTRASLAVAPIVGSKTKGVQLALRWGK